WLGRAGPSEVLVPRLAPEELAVERSLMESQAQAQAAALQPELEKKSAAGREERLKREALEKAERDRLQAEQDARRRAEEEAAKRPLPFRLPAPYMKQPFAAQQSVYVGDHVAAEDFFSELQGDVSDAGATVGVVPTVEVKQLSQQAQAAVVVPAEPTPAEIN